MNHQIASRLLAALLCSLPLVALALEEDKLQEIVIEGDSAKLDEKTGEITYEGNVTLIQGSLELASHRLHAKREAGQVVRISASHGESRQQVHYSQRIRQGEPKVTASADEMVYDLRAQTLELAGSAVLRQDDVEFMGDIIRYDITRGGTEALGEVLMRLPGRFLEDLDNNGNDAPEQEADAP